MHSSADWIEQLQLEPHREGGYFRRVYQADHRPLLESSRGLRFSMTSIYYMLTSEKPIGCLHKNQSDIMHVFCGGEPLTYYLVDDSGELEIRTLGPDPWAGHELQFVVPGGVWKGTELRDGSTTDVDFGLLCEVVVPGFDYADMEMANAEAMIAAYPQHKALMKKLCLQ